MHADVKRETGQARVIYGDAKQTPEKLRSTVDMLGFQASLVSEVDARTKEAPPRR